MNMYVLISTHIPFIRIVAVAISEDMARRHTQASVGHMLGFNVVDPEEFTCHIVDTTKTQVVAVQMVNLE